MTDVLKFPLINGYRHSFSSIKFKIQPSKESGLPELAYFIKSIDYDRTRDRGEVRANHPDPIAKTIGENSYSASIEIYRAEFQQILSVFGEGYGDVQFTILVQWGISGFETVTDEIVGCTIDSSGTGGSQGPDPSVVKIDLKPLKIYFGGIDDLAIPLEAP